MRSVAEPAPQFRNWTVLALVVDGFAAVADFRFAELDAWKLSFNVEAEPRVAAGHAVPRMKWGPEVTSRREAAPAKG